MVLLPDFQDDGLVWGKRQVPADRLPGFPNLCLFLDLHVFRLRGEIQDGNSVMFLTKTPGCSNALRQSAREGWLKIQFRSQESVKVVLEGVLRAGGDVICLSLTKTCLLYTSRCV